MPEAAHAWQAQLGTLHQKQDGANQTHPSGTLSQVPVMQRHGVVENPLWGARWRLHPVSRLGLGSSSCGAGQTEACSSQPWDVLGVHQSGFVEGFLAAEPPLF